VDHFPDAKDSTVIYVMAQQYRLERRYAGPDGVFGRQDMKFVASDNVFGVDPSDPNGKDDIQTLNEIHVPSASPSSSMSVPRT
jgi:cytochrome c oxidase subunit II